MSKKQRRVGTTILAALTGLAITVTAGNIANADEKAPSTTLAAGIQTAKTTSAFHPTAKFGKNLATASGPISVFIQLTGPGTFDATQPQSVKDGKAAPVNKSGIVKDMRAKINVTATSVAKEAGATAQLYVTTNTIPGIAITADAANIRLLSHRSDVVKITPIVSKHFENKGTDIDTKVLNAWTQNHATGKGATIAVLDTGLDYTHADFGGPGTVSAYTKAKALTTFPTAADGVSDPNKFIGGHDLVGDDYNADPAAGVGYQPIPHPDDNPLDCTTAGHGTHVAGTAAGYGVN
ncbi:MAG: S8 family serine peptidase, partial [Acidobacteria bacterium]|nr:S8 family serine peptidase [Acidobacteriota bacterium]